MAKDVHQTLIDIAKREGGLGDDAALEYTSKRQAFGKPLVEHEGVGFMLAEHPVVIWSFFFGLVLASIVVVGRRIMPFGIEIGFALGVGIALGFLVTRLIPLEAEITPLALFAGGCIAVCAWILPGMSGSFILLVLGLYQTVIEAIRQFEVLTIAYVLLKR